MAQKKGKLTMPKAPKQGATLKQWATHEEKVKKVLKARDQVKKDKTTKKSLIDRVAKLKQKK